MRPTSWALVRRIPAGVRPQLWPSTSRPSLVLTPLSKDSTASPPYKTSSGTSCLPSAFRIASRHPTSSRRHFATSSSHPTPLPASFQPFKSTPPELVPLLAGERVADLKKFPKLACHRRSPFICPNQLLLDELSILYEFRAIGAEPGPLEDRHALAYEKAMSTIKSYPTKFRNKSEAKALPFIGLKIGDLIGEFLQTGQIELAQTLRADERLRTCILFQTLHSVGPITARILYDELGCRSLEDVYKHHPDLRLEVDLWDELQTKIPREETEEIGAFLRDELEKVSPGCQFTICGGYRRGKPSSKDVDMVFTHPSSSSAVDIKALNAFVKHLETQGHLTGVLSGSTQARGNSTRALCQKYVVLKLPEKEGGEKRVHRRVDIVFAPRDVYWTAVLGWTGSTSFERDLRVHAWSNSLKFDSSGIVQASTDEIVEIDPRLGERGVFELLGVEYLEPEERCADP